MPQRTKRYITADDLYRFEVVTDCRVSPGGEHVAYAVKRTDRETEKRFSNIWVAPTRGGRSRQFTRGDNSDDSPRWSPDGTQIAFTSTRNQDKAQLFVIPFDGGEARQVTDMRGEFGEITWTPEGASVICLFRKQDESERERQDDERRKKLGIVDRHYTRTFFKMDGEGYRPDERMHVWKIDVGSGRAKQITDGDFDTESFAVSPDGHMIAFISNRTPEPDLHLEQVDLWTVSVTGGEPRLIPTPVGEIGYPSFSPDGAFIAYTGVEGIGAWGRNERLYIVPTEGDTPRVDLTGEYDVNVSAWTLDDVVGARQMPPTWSPNGKRIYFQTAHHGNTELRSVKSDGSDMRIELAGPGAVGPYSFDARHAQVAHRLSDRSGPGQVWTRNLRTGASRKLTRLNEQWMARIQLGSVEDVWFTSADGEAEVQGWILHPPGFDPSKRYPSVLEIHGGPHLQYGNTFVHEFEVFAANGYVVFYCNPRGSQGYGQRHARAIENDWGGCDYDDVMQWAEIVAERPYIDPKRMGVTGGSYGGFMTNWIIGHTNRFAAAVTQRSVSNLISMYGSSDLNWAFQREFGDKPPWEDVDNYWRQSPMAYIGNATTPTLVIHSERDFRCDIEQGEQVYVALKRLGVDTEFVRFPEESHGLSRGGRTDRRIARLGHMLRWFDRYLLPTDESAS